MRPTKLMIRLTAAEKDAVARAAQIEGLKAASWARRTILRAVREDVTPYRVESQLASQGPQLLSLFCGAGGLDEGFRQAGFRTQVAIDIDAAAVRTFGRNHPAARAQQASVTDLTLEKLDALADGLFEPIGVIGGPPCQSFSVSNVHQSDQDPRHHLPEAYAALLAQLNQRRPISFFVFENVPGLLGTKHRHRYERFKELFAEAGFVLNEWPLDAQEHGVPQVRPRIIIVGVNEVLHPGRVLSPPASSAERLTVRQTIEGLPDPVRNARGLDPESFAVHPNHWCLVPKSSKFEKGRLKPGDMWGRSFRTLEWDKPSWTVAYGHREVHVHPNGKRRLSIYEAMLLQTFPKEYRLLGTMTDQVRLVSDAVPPRLAFRIAQSIRDGLGI